MSEVIINFESEKLEGVVAVGTYLLDAAKRLGVKVDCDCLAEEAETKGSCAMKISKGRALLSSPTELESELLSSQARKNGERLACQAKIEKPGEVTVMSVKTKEKTEEEKTAEQETQKEDYKKQFEDLPLEEKISNLMELEAIALGETFSFVVNSPYKAVEKVMDVLAGFGLKMEKEDHDAKRPDEHVKEEKSDEKKKTRSSTKKKTAAKKTPAKKPAAKKTTRKRTTRKRKAKKKEETDDKK